MSNQLCGVCERPHEVPPLDGLCPSCFVVVSQEKEAGQPQPGQLDYLPPNDVMRNVHRKLLRQKDWGTASH